MPARLLLDESSTSDAKRSCLVLRGGPNWTAVLFFAALGLLHLTIWSTALSRRHTEGYMSLIFGGAFSAAAVAFYLVRVEIAVLPEAGLVRLRTGCRGLHVERRVPFNRVQCVRITIAAEPDHAAGLIELVCAGEVIECPPTPVARQEALCLAVLIGVRLVKVSGAAATARVV